MSQPGQYMAPATFHYTPGMGGMTSMLGAGSPMMSMPSQPQSPGTQNSEQGVMNLILQRLDHMDKKLGQLDTIQSSIANITVKVSDIETKVHTLETKVNTLETSRGFDSESVDVLNKKQKEIDSLLTKMKKLEADQSAKESDLQAKVLDMQCRSMRDNLIFYKIPEAVGETDADCVQKVLDLIENDLEIENANRDIKLHRAHRMGKLIIINERLKKWALQNETISDAQFGFKADYSTVDAIFIIQSLINKATNKKKNLYACFIDLKRAFDSVYIFIYLFIQYFKRVAHLAVQLFYLAALCANIFTYIQTL